MCLCVVRARMFTYIHVNRHANREEGVCFIIGLTVITLAFFFSLGSFR